MRRTTTILVSLVLVAAFAGATDIPPRPEDLVFPVLDFQVPDANAMRFELSNGIPVYVLEDTAFPLVNLSVWFRGGRYLEPDGKAGLTGIADEVWRTGGAGDLTAQALDEELDFLAANVSTRIGDTTGSVGLNVLSKDLDRAMALYMDILTKPRFQKDRFDKAVDDLVQDMRTRNDDMTRIVAREWDRLIYGDDFWVNRLATEASATSLTPDDARALVARLITAGNIVVSVSGDISKERAKELLESTLGTLPAAATPLPAVPQPTHQAKPGVYLVNKADVNQGGIRFGQLGFTLGNPDEFPLRVGADILGGGGFTARFMKKIRSDEALTYGAYISMPFPTAFPGTVYGGLQTKSSTAAYAIQLGLQLTKTMATTAATDAKYSGPPTEEEMRTSKASFIETFPQNFQSPAQTTGLFAQDELLGRPHSYWTTWRDNVRAVTSAQVQQAFKKDIHPDSFAILVVGNLEEIEAGHPDHDAKIADFGPITILPLRDPMTLEPITE
jgi:zinc protease